MPVLILYDRDCGFCRWMMGLLLTWDRRGRLRPAQIQGEEGERALAGMDQERRLVSAHAVLEDGTVFSGGDAFERVARELPAGAPFALLARQFPQAADSGYRWVAERRDRIGPRVPRGWKDWGDKVISDRRSLPSPE